MKISNSKKQLAKIISENDGWIAGGFAAQQDDGEVWFSVIKPVWKTRCGTFDMGYEGHLTIGHLISNRHQTILARDEYFHLYPAPDADGWIEWKGGECPVDGDEFVVCKVRSGREWRDGKAIKAKVLRWRHTGGIADIIAYRLHKPEHAGQEYPDADGWIEWKGGKCPVERGVMVDIKLRNGESANKLPANTPVDGRNPDASCAFWAHNGSQVDIIAYRLHKTEVKVVTNPERIVIEPEPTIEQLATDYRAKLAIAQQAQEEADSHRCGAEAALERLVAAGKALGLVLSVAAPEPELVITDWRDLRVGDVIAITSVFGRNNNDGYEDLLGCEAVVVSVGDPGVQDLKVSSGRTTVLIDGFRFIRRPAKGDTNA